jgi:hypothetical protein
MKDKSSKPQEAPSSKPQAAPAAPAAAAGGFQGEKMLTVKAKSMVNIAGVTHQTGDVFQLPEREALSLVGTGSAEELPGDAPAPTQK